MKSRRNLQRLRFPQVVSYGGQQGAVLQTVSEGVVGSVAAGSAAAAVAVGAAVVGWLVASAKCQQAVAGTLAVGARTQGVQVRARAAEEKLMAVGDRVLAIVDRAQTEGMIALV